jgi:hypothetical protein
MAQRIFVQVWNPATNQIILAEIRRWWTDSRKREHAEALIGGEWVKVFKRNHNAIWEIETKKG